MTPFLKQVAKHYFDHTTSENDFCYVFPNRRSMLFFKKYYCLQVKAAGITMFEPQMYTINDFFYKVYAGAPTERIDLLLNLYREYKKLIPNCEPLDEFIFWGEMILSDFNDVDKYLIDAEKLFTNVSQFKSMQDYTFLSENQLKALQAFMGHFAPQAGEDGKYKENFRKTWDILYPLYKSFNSALSEQGKSYEGMVYRRLAERFESESASDVLQDAFPHSPKFVFVGLNAPTESELAVLKRMRQAQLAEFCWDYSSEMIKDKANKSSFFMEDNIRHLGQSIKLDPEGLPTAQINVLAVPSAVGQCKQIGQIFRRLGGEIGINTAIVLPDEKLLLPTLNAIPDSISKVNVTMGYPMSGSVLYSLIDEICAMQMHIRERSDGNWAFYYKQAYDLFANPLLKDSLCENERQTIDSVKCKLFHYIDRDEIAVDGQILSRIFTPIVKEPNLADKGQITALCEYLKDIIETVAHKLVENKKESVELEFAKDFYQAIECIEKYELEVLPATFFRLLRNLVGRNAVPFKGEPLQGLQIMGPLETRALDFDNLVILSCNEGVFPRHNSSESFIPPELRKGFGLPTHEYQDALWAYYFYRLIQRCENVWLVYNTSVQQKMNSCEESRYIKQLELHFGVKIHRYVAKSTILEAKDTTEIAKTQEDIDILKNTRLSATALQKYLSCQVQFYYSKIKKLSNEDEVNETLDAGLIGSVLHESIEEIYSGKERITKDFLSECLKKETYAEVVRRHIMDNLKCIEISGRNLIYEGLICRYVRQILLTDKKLLEKKNLDSFRILELEKKETDVIEGLKFIGIMDRVDSFEDGVIRVVDYKTGSVKDSDIQIDDENACEVADAAFGEDNDKRPKIAIQLYLYDVLIRKAHKTEAIENVIYQTTSLFSEGIKSAPMNETFVKEMGTRLEECLKGLLDIDKPWTKTAHAKTCSYCDFKDICGR